MNQTANMSPAITNDYPFMGLPLGQEGITKENVQHSFHQSDPTSMNHQEQRHPKMEKRKSEPIKFKLERSESELQLYENERAAEYRDHCMYLRIVGGMSNKSPKTPIDPILANVVRTRHSYSTMSDSDVDYSHGVDKDTKLSTPVLCGAPIRLVDLAFAPRMPIGTFAPRHLPMVDAVRYAAAAADDCYSDDEIFDLDL